IKYDELEKQIKYLENGNKIIVKLEGQIDKMKNKEIKGTSEILSTLSSLTRGPNCQEVSKIAQKLKDIFTEKLKERNRIKQKQEYDKIFKESSQENQVSSIAVGFEENSQKNQASSIAVDLDKWDEKTKKAKKEQYEKNLNQD